MEELQEVKSVVREEFQNLQLSDTTEDFEQLSKEKKANYSSGSDKVQDEILRSLKQLQNELIELKTDEANRIPNNNRTKNTGNR